MKSYLATMVHAARRAGSIVKRHYLSETLEVRKKTAQGDLVSSADLEAERAILSILRRAFPEASMVAEESGGTHESGAAFPGCSSRGPATRRARGRPRRSRCDASRSP